MYFPKFFALHELVPYKIYSKVITLNDKIKAFWLLDDRILRAADALRERYGKLICNDWYWASKIATDPWSNIKGHQYRGWRPQNCMVGAKLSQHKWGRALDLTPVECTAEEIRKDLIDMAKGRGIPFPYITAIEMNVSWLHIDCRSWNPNNLHLIYP